MSAFFLTILVGGLGCLVGLWIGLPEIGSILAIATMGACIIDVLQNKKKGEDDDSHGPPSP